MGKLLISAFKAKCLALLERVRKIKAICITRRQIPLAGGVVAVSVVERSAWIGSMSDSIEILDDIISPANEESEWEALRD
jgi:hypothetical protein